MKYHLGQPVRMINSLHGRPSMEGFIDAIGPVLNYQGLVSDYGVTDIQGEGWVVDEWQLEPILPKPEEEEFEEAFALVVEHKERQRV